MSWELVIEKMVKRTKMIDAYTKTESDNLLNSKANTADVYPKTETYTKTEVDNAIAGIDVSNKLTKNDLEHGYIYLQTNDGHVVATFDQFSAGQSIVRFQANEYLKAYVADDGKIYATDFVLTSDIRKKENIQEITEDIKERFLKIPIVEFSMKDDKKHKRQYGTIAQDLQKLFPDLVEEDKEFGMTVHYNSIAMLAVKMVQELIKEQK